MNYQVQPDHIVSGNPPGAIIELDSNDATTIALLDAGSISATIDPSLAPGRAPRLEEFFWALQSDSAYNSLVAVAYEIPALFAPLDRAAKLFLAPNVFESTIAWALQQLADAIADTDAEHSLDRDAIVAQINTLAAANDFVFTLS